MDSMDALVMLDMKTHELLFLKHGRDLSRISRRGRSATRSSRGRGGPCSFCNQRSAGGCPGCSRGTCR